MSKATDKARDERLEAMHETLVQKTEALVTSEGWAAYLDFAAKFHNYSLNNLLLILAQRPDATRVASYKKWGELGRQVRKGERSLGIFAPMTRKREDPDGTEHRYVSGFKIVPVFDVSQTDGDALPDDVSRPVLLDGEAPEGLWDALAALVVARGYRIERGDCGGRNGFTQPSDMLVKVRDDVSDAQACKTLAHELGHVMLHTEDKTLCADAMAHRNVSEVEAESIAYLVAAEHGLPTDRYTLPYVSGWSDGKSEMVALTADRVLKASREILAKTAPAEETAAA